jgi:hypothetical protein
VATATIFAAFVLTAMQVGLATEKLGKNTDFQRASYGFTVFSLVGPICFVVLMALIALFNLFVDLPGLLSDTDKALADTQIARVNNAGAMTTKTQKQGHLVSAISDPV